MAALLWMLVAVIACGGATNAPSSTSAAADTSGSLTDAGVLRDVAAAAASPGFRFRGMWVLCEGTERVLSDPARVDQLIERAVALGVTDLFVQVYRGGRAWYDADLADATPYRETLERQGTDVLRHLLERARGADLRVHAWVNVLSLNGNRKAPIVEELGPGAVLVDRRGRSLLDYPGLDVPAPDRDWYRMGTPGLYLDPAAPGVRARLVATFLELLERYPELDGLHLDYIRHPGVLPFVPGSRFGVGLDFGYGSATRERFRRESGRTDPFADPTNPATSALVNTTQWDDWRREQVTTLVSAIRTAALAAAPDLLISAAVIPYADRAYLSLAQDWRGWLEAGLVDFAVPMVYSRDDRLFRYQVEAFAAGPGADRLWIGLGTWLFAESPARAVAQLEVVAESGAVGEVLFSYDAIAAAPGLLDALIGARGNAGE
jgi:uncharacterized lipoprotein YddW (UPF0748 family)